MGYTIQHFLQFRAQPPEVAPLRHWLDSWTGIGAIVTGMERQGYDLSLIRYEDGWRATFIRRDHSTRPWVGQVLTFHPTPLQAVQHAARSVLDKDRDAQEAS